MDDAARHNGDPFWKHPRVQKWSPGRSPNISPVEWEWSRLFHSVIACLVFSGRPDEKRPQRDDRCLATRSILHHAYKRMRERMREGV